MDPDDGLHRAEGILPGRGRVVDEGFGDDDVLGRTRHQVDVLLAELVHRRLELLKLLDGPVKLVLVGRVLGQQRVDLRPGQADDEAGGQGPDGHVAGFVADQLPLAKVFAVGEQRDSQVTAVNALAQNLHLSLSHDEEAVFLVALAHQSLAQRDDLGDKVAGQGRQNGVREPGEQGDAPKRLGGERGGLSGDVEFHPLGLGSSTFVRFTR